MSEQQRQIWLIAKLYSYGSRGLYPSTLRVLNAQINKKQVTHEPS